MPDSSLGMTGNEIVSYVQNFIGNTASDLQLFLQQSLPLAELRFCKMHDWSFLTKNNLSFTVTSGTDNYTLSSGTVGYYVAASDIKTIFSNAGNMVLGKTSLDVLRRRDPDQNDGTLTTHITHWAPVADNTIQVYPPIFVDTTLKVDAKITPNSLYTLTNYPTIPMRYQETFLQYMISLAFSRENDDRFQAKQQEVAILIRDDIEDDLNGSGDVNIPRIKHYGEASFDGTSANIEALYNLWAFNSNDF